MEGFGWLKWVALGVVGLLLWRHFKATTAIGSTVGGGSAGQGYQSLGDTFIPAARKGRKHF